MNMNIAGLLHKTSLRQGASTAFVDGDNTIDFALLQAMAERAGRQFERLGISHVVFADHGSAAFPIALFGAAWAGIPFVPVDSTLHHDDLRHFVSQLRPVLLIGDASARQSVSGLEGVASVLVDEFVDGTQRGDALHVWPTDPTTPGVLIPRRDMTDVSTLAFEHRQLCRLATFVSGVDTTDDERQLIARPLRDARTTVALLASMRRGRSVELRPEADRRGEALLDAIEHSEITHLELDSERLPALIAAAQARLDRGIAVASTLTEIVVGDRPLPASVTIEAAHVLGATVEVGLGLVSAGVSQIRTFASELELTRSAPGTLVLGRPTIGVEAELRTPEGARVQPGEVGELYLAGPFGDEGAPPLFLASGLQATQADNGWLRATTTWLTDEEDAHTELIDLLAQHDAVAEVRSIGGAERPQLVVVVDDDCDLTTEELTSWARERV